MHRSQFRSKITKYMIGLCAVSACILLSTILVPIGQNENKLTEIFFSKPVLAQEAGAFPADEAGISAYLNVGQTIDLAKAKSALRGIQAEGDNYVIGIIELHGLPEEEFPHMYISMDGWILAYYSKFAPSSRIFQWYGYQGGPITTTTLQDAIARLCPTIGVNFIQVKGDVAYYHFNYLEATKVTIAVDTTEGMDDTFNYSIPLNVVLYEGSFSHYSRGDNSVLKDESYGVISITNESGSYIDCERFEDPYVVPNKPHMMRINRISGYTTWHPDWQGVAVVFIYR